MSVKSFKTSGVGVDLAPKGLVLINTTSFSGVTTQSVNNVFTSTYDNYRIIIRITGASAAGSTFFRLRASGSDKATNYNYQTGLSENTSVTAVRNNAQTLVPIRLYATDYSLNVFDVSGPNLNEPTVGNIQIAARISGAGGFLENIAFAQTENYQADGFTFGATSSSSFTGSVSVYGYNK